MAITLACVDDGEDGDGNRVRDRDRSSDGDGVEKRSYIQRQSLCQIFRLELLHGVYVFHDGF